MSLDPSKNTTFHIVQPKNHASELEVRKNVVQESQISISNKQEQYNQEDVTFDDIELEKIFDAIAQGKGKITVDDLYLILREEGYQDTLYSAVDMIALVDEGRKGYLTKKEFMAFFSNKTYVDEEKIPPLSEQMNQQRKWVKSIEENWDFFK